MIEEIKKLEEEVKQLKLERDTAVFVARDRLDSIEMIRNQKEIFELRYLKEEKENDKLHSIIKEVREYGKEVLSWTTNEPITDEIGEHILEIVEKEEVPYNTDEEQQDYLWENIDEDNIELGE